MERSNVDIISQLKSALDKQTEIAEFWREQAMLLLDRDVENAIYGKSRLEILGATHEI